MNNPVKSIVLIGMPGAGKSTVGVLLAKELGMDFLDTDVAIQVREGTTLQTLLDATDYMNLRRIEEEVLLEIDTRPRVIATGGSAVYSPAAMRKLRSAGTIIYLRAPAEVLLARIDNYDSRGIACQPGQGFDELYTERSKLYEKYAEFAVECGDVNPAEVVSRLLSICS